MKMIVQKKPLGNLTIDVCGTQDVLKEMDIRLQKREKTTVYFLNAHCYNIAQKDEEYRTILNNVDMLLNDGIGVQLGAKFYGIHFKENLNGTDFIPKLLNLASQKEYTVFLLGSSPGTAESAAKNLYTSFPRLRIVGCHHGFFDEKENHQIIQEINNISPDILIVGRGVPIQEKWIANNKNKINASIMLGVGAFIDFTSGRIPRAPRVVRAIKMEWLFRLLLEPNRMWKRYLVGNFLFFYYIVKNRKCIQG